MARAGAVPSAIGCFCARLRLRLRLRARAASSSPRLPVPPGVGAGCHGTGHFLNSAARLVAAWFLLSLRKWIMDLAMNLCTALSAASKVAQLQSLWAARDAGAVSALTWGLAAYTSATRIVTTLMTTNDLTILVRFAVMLALNLWVTATVLRYRKAGVKAE